MGTSRVTPELVVVASDIHDDERREVFHSFLIDEIGAKPRTESAYDFDFAACGQKWDKLISRIEAIIDGRRDTVFLWDYRENSFIRTKIGQ